MIFNRFQQDHKILMSLRSQILGDFWQYRSHRKKQATHRLLSISFTGLLADGIDLTEKPSPKFTGVHRSSPKFTGVHRRLPPISPNKMYMCCDYRVKSGPTEVHRSSPKFTEVYSQNLTDVAHCMQQLAFCYKHVFFFIENHICVLKTLICFECFCDVVWFCWFCSTWMFCI